MKNALKSSLLTLTIATAVFAGANPAAAAQTLTLPHTAQPVAVPIGAKNQLNPQPIPPGHVAMPILNSLVTSALNTQPIPPGHVTSLSRTYSTDSLAAGKGSRGLNKSGKPHTGWDVSKNKKS